MRSKHIGVFLLILVAGLFVVLFAVLGLSPNPAQAQTTSSLESDLEVQVDSVMSMSLTNCDATNNSVVKLDVTPSSAGAFKSNCQTVDIDTNSPGYSLSAKASNASLQYLNPTTIAPTPTIPSTTNTIASPNTITNETWGFAVEGNGSFDASYAVDNASNKYAQLPTTDTTLYHTTTFPLPQTEHEFFYATKLTPATMAGTYATTVTYTAVGEVPQPVPCTSSDEIICIKITEPGTIRLQNKWNSPITYSVNGAESVTLTGVARTDSLDVAVGDLIEIDETVDGTTFRSWYSSDNALVTGTAKASMTKIPPMNHFTTDSTGATAARAFFYMFNYNGILTSLPSGSFDTSNITSEGGHFFASFNGRGALTSLPAGSFNISNITSVGSYFFNGFNSYGALTSLPAGSFDTSNIVTTAAEPGYFFQNFNNSGALTSLPAGSFNISNVTKAGSYFFYDFNSGGALTSLPAGSFDTSNITKVSRRFFYNFNSGGALTSLPAGSFNISNVTEAGSDFFYGFNSGGALTSLPAGSFDTSNVVTTGDNFFARFNIGGALTSLPVGSFNTSNITSVGGYFFYYFNRAGALTSLPAGSFNTSNITTAGVYLLTDFNGSGSSVGNLQAGTGVTITNTSSNAVTFWQRPNGNPDGTATSTTVSVGGTITFLAE